MRTFFARLGVAAVLLLIVAIFLTQEGYWRILSSSFGVGNPDAVVSAPSIPKPNDGNQITSSGVKDFTNTALDKIFGENRPSLKDTHPQFDTPSTAEESSRWKESLLMLDQIPTKNLVSLSGYTREYFGKGWVKSDGCDTRNRILARDLKSITYADNKECMVATGVLDDPYTGLTIDFERGTKTSSAVQIDHIVPLANAYRSGAQKLSAEDRVAFANDPANLLAVDGPTNGAKGAKSLEEWLPSNDEFWCDYVDLWVNVKNDWGLWMTAPEKSTATEVLTDCISETD